MMMEPLFKALGARHFMEAIENAHWHKLPDKNLEETISPPEVSATLKCTDFLEY